MKTLFLTFFFYSFAGFLLEVVYARLTRCPKRDRKCFLFLPLCPVYGLGAIAILSLPPFVLDRPLLLLVMGGLTATAAEWAVSLFYDWGAGVRFWDYAQRPLNVAGRICPLYTFFWGLLALALVRLAHPAVSGLLQRAPDSLALLLFPLLAADGLLTLWLLHRTGDTAVLRWYDPPAAPETA